MAKKKPQAAARPSSEPQSIADLLPDDRNANTHTERGMGLLEEQLRVVGAGRSILLDKHNRIIAGNGVAEAAGSIGITKVRVVETEGDELVAVKRLDVDLDSPLGRQMALGDNLIALRNIDLDAQVVKELAEEHKIDLDKLGMSEKELNRLLEKQGHEAAAEDMAGGVEDIPEKWMIVITCRDEIHQAELLERFAGEGLECRALL